MEPIGQKLKQARLEKGISLEEAHKKTKINLSILNAIEEDRLVNFNPVYIKGFLKIYCKFLGVDSPGGVSDYKEPAAAAPSLLRQEEKRDPFFKANPPRSASSRVNQEKIKAAAAAVLIIVFIWVALFSLGRVISLRRHKALSRKPRAAVINPAPGAGKKVEKIKIDAEAPGISSVLRLGIRTREDCWVQLKVDGKITFQNILKKGRSESWQAKEKIELSLGNAAGVDLEVNGKVISNLGKKGQALKNILITKEGLVIKR